MYLYHYIFVCICFFPFFLLLFFLFFLVLFTIGERLVVTQSTPPLMMARLSLATASLHADQNEAHDWVIGFWDVSVAFHHAKIEELVYVHPPRGTCPSGSSTEHSSSFQSMERSGERHTGQRECDFRGSGYVVTIHGDDFIAAGCQQGLDSLNHTMENNFRTKTAGNNRAKL